MTERNNRNALALSFLAGGLVAGGLAFMFAPRLARLHRALFARADEQRDDGEAYCAEEGTFRVIPEGADVCFGEEADQ